MTPDDFETELERLGHRPRPEYGLEDAWVQLQAAMVEDRTTTSQSVSIDEGLGNKKGRILRGMGGLGRQTLRGWLLSMVAGAVILVGVYRTWPAVQRAITLAPTMTGVREVGTAKGQIASITLSDGTHVTVGVASRLTIPTDFGVRNRTLMLDGEALFSVTDHSTTPFVVRTATSSTRVLGTSFTVRHYAADSAIMVTVLAGKVALENAVVTAGQQGTRVGRGRVSVRPVTDHNATAWVTGRIAFDDAPLNRVVTELNRWYGVQFVLADPALANERVTVGFIGRSADEVAAVLDGILGTTHRRTSTQIIVSR